MLGDAMKGKYLVRMLKRYILLTAKPYAEFVGRTKNGVVSFFPGETIEQGKKSSLA